MSSGSKSKKVEKNNKHFNLKDLSEMEANAMVTIYNRWKEEIFYRRNRTTFITTWTSTLFIAIIGGKLAGGVNFDYPSLILGTALVGSIWGLSMYYFIHNVIMHARAKNILVNLEKKFTINNETLFELTYDKKPSGMNKILNKNFSERGSKIQAFFVSLVAALCITALWIG